MAVFDVAIIGAGINGCASAYFLAKAGLSVAIFDKEGIASGGGIANQGVHQVWHAAIADQVNSW